MVFKLLKALKLLLKTTCNLGGIALFLLGENLFKTLFYLIDFQQNISYRLSHRICQSSRQKQKVFTCVVIIFHLLLSLWDQRSSLAGGAQVKVKQSQSSVQAATTSRWNSFNARLNLTYCWNTWSMWKRRLVICFVSPKKEQKVWHYCRANGTS